MKIKFDIKIKEDQMLRDEIEIKKTKKKYSKQTKNNQKN